MNTWRCTKIIFSYTSNIWTLIRFENTDIEFIVHNNIYWETWVLLPKFGIREPKLSWDWMVLGVSSLHRLWRNSRLFDSWSEFPADAEWNHATYILVTDEIYERIKPNIHEIQKNIDIIHGVHSPLGYSHQTTKPRMQSRSRTKKVRTSLKSKPLFWWRSPGSLKWPLAWVGILGWWHWSHGGCYSPEFDDDLYVTINHYCQAGRHIAKELRRLSRLVYWLHSAIFGSSSKTPSSPTIEVQNIGMFVEKPLHRENTTATYNIHLQWQNTLEPVFSKLMD